MKILITIPKDLDENESDKILSEIIGLIKEITGQNDVSVGKIIPIGTDEREFDLICPSCGGKAHIEHDIRQCWVHIYIECNACGHTQDIVNW